MKDLIVIVGSILLGVIILNMMIGPGDGTMKSAMKDVMKKSVLIYQER